MLRLSDLKARGRNRAGITAPTKQLLESSSSGEESREYIGYVDGFVDSKINGWAKRKNPSNEVVTVALCVGDDVYRTVVSTDYRQDLDALGHGKCAYNIDVDDSVIRAAEEADGYLRIRILSSPIYEIGKVDVNRSAINVSGERVEKIRALTAVNIRTIDRAATTGMENTHKDENKSGTQHFYDQILNAVDKEESLSNIQPFDISKYAYYVLHRYKLDNHFATKISHEERAHYLNWYLNEYSKIRAKYRIPLSSGEITYLNEIQVLGGVRHSLSRGTWMALVTDNHRLRDLDLSNPDNFSSIVYWWCVHRAKSINCEDCLVPDTYISALTRVGPAWKTKRFQLNYFSEQYFNENVRFHFLDMMLESDRKIYYFLLMVESIDRPDIIQFLPHNVLELIFQIRRKSNIFSDIIALIPGLGSRSIYTRESFADMIRSVAFDIDSRRFLTTSSAGNRVHAVSLVVPNDSTRVNVQIIGPFQKASGLGQATRLSARAISKSSYKMNCVDFGLDNPAPEGYSHLVDTSDYCQADVNLIHLNAESVPLVAAYSPDIYKDSYNIGYFYWELDSPADCHALALDLLDEIWVSSEYGKRIYQEAFAGPVINVGMAFEEVPGIESLGDRHKILKKIRASEKDFIFLVVFDSFSFIQRKNPLEVIESFRRAFPAQPDARLVIKTQNRSNVLDPLQVKIWRQLDEILMTDKRITVLDETLPYAELMLLKAVVDCYVSLHRSEGWGFGMIEAMNLNTPVICTAYSGNMEFCNEKNSYLVDYDEIMVRPEEYIFVKLGQKWAQPRLSSAVAQMREIYNDPDRGKMKAKSARIFVEQYFSLDPISIRYENRLKEIFSGIK